MKKSIMLLAIIAFCMNLAYGQKYFTRDGNISFYSESPLENIEAHNSKATSVIDTESGRLEFAVLIKAFQFEKALMQEHFNENYMESDQFPKATFKGRIEDSTAVDFNRNGEYQVQVSGDITIHGVTQPLTTDGTIAVKDGIITAKAMFELTVADFEIEIPAVVRDNIARIVEVKVDMKYEPLQN